MSSRRSQSKVTTVGPPIIAPKATVDQIKAADRSYTPESSRKPLPDFAPLIRNSPCPRSASKICAADHRTTGAGQQEATAERLDHAHPAQLACVLGHESRCRRRQAGQDAGRPPGAAPKGPRRGARKEGGFADQRHCGTHKSALGGAPQARGFQSEAALELKNGLSEMYQKTVGSQTDAIQGLEKQLSSMNKSRDEALKEMGLRAQEIMGLQREVSGWIKGYEDRVKEIGSLRTELSQLKESLEGRQREAFQFRQNIQGLQKQLTSSRELAVAKSNELLKREEGLEALKAQTEKSVVEIKKETERVVLEAEKNVLDAEKNAEEAQGIIEENKKEGDKIQRELQDDIAKLRVKEVDSKRKIRRLLEVIRDAAPDKFREEVMKDNFFDIMF